MLLMKERCSRKQSNCKFADIASEQCMKGRSFVNFMFYCIYPCASVVKRLVRSYKITRSSPTRRVTRSRSRYSSKGIAYLRLTPVSSLNLPTSIFGDFVL